MVSLRRVSNKTAYLPSEQQGPYTELWRTSEFGQKRSLLDSQPIGFSIQ